MRNIVSIALAFLKNRALQIISIFIFFTAFHSHAQVVKTDSVNIENKISISDISFYYENLQSVLSDLSKDAQPTNSIKIIDSTHTIFSERLDSLKIKIIQDSSRYTLRIIESLENEWEGYKTKMHSWQLEISEHAHLLESFQDTLLIRNKTWEKTLAIAKEKEAPNAIIKRIISAQDSIAAYSQSFKEISIEMLHIQENIMAGLAKVDEVIDHLQLANLDFKGKLFALNSPPIWKWETEKSTIDFYAETKANFADQERIVEIFFKDHLTEFLFHSLSFIFLILLFVFLKRKYLGTSMPGDDIRLKMAIITIKKPIFAALTIGVVLSLFFYKDSPDIINYALVFIILIPTLYFFPRFVEIRNMKIVFFLIALYYLDKFQEMIVVDELLNRVLQLFKSVSVLFILYSTYKTQISNRATDNKGWQSIVKAIAPILFVLIIISFIANIFGAYHLSELLIEGVLTSSLFAIIFMVTGVVASSLLVISLRSKYVSSLKVFSEDNLKFESRITNLIYLFAAILWMKIMLKSFQLLDVVLGWYNAFVDLYWKVGSVTISVGGVISFFFILFITFLLARLIKELINDHIIPVKKSAKGLPNAFSMVFRYMIVSLGVYIAMAAVGINLSEFGLMAGALGVGLGFGLQNILHNLVSGLIVSFERPIHVGDTVEVANLMGIVTEIGVRSSKIRTYEGSEVILPNGDLLSKQVINWTLSDHKRRLEIKVRSSFDANPHEVLDILNLVLNANESILKEPGPLCLFEGYGDSALNFRVLFWVPLNIGLTTKSQVALSIYDKLKEKNIEAPIHQQRLLYQDSQVSQAKPM